MNAERLLKLADFLEQLPPQKFNFAVIMKVGRKSPLEALAAREESCGTVGCAMGWMPVVFPDDIVWVAPMPGWEEHGMNIGRKGDCTEINWDIIPDFFEISMWYAECLFMPDVVLPETATALEVAEHIREFVREKSS